MRRTAASLAAVVVALAGGGCGDGAEPDAPSGGAPARALTLVLDYQPNAVHSGIYAALAEGALARRGIELEVREPGDSADAAKLLASGRADLAILDIHDLAIARERGFDLVGVGAIVQRPLAAVIAADRERVRTPDDLDGLTVGLTGAPSDDAVLAAVLGSAPGPAPEVETVTIGFASVPALANGRVDAATAFWNAEGVALRELGVPTRELRVDKHGAPRYPELVLATARRTLERERAALAAALGGLREGYALAAAEPRAALADLLAAVPGLQPRTQRAQMEALEGAFEPALELDRQALEAWARWDAERGIVSEPPEVARAFDLDLLAEGG
jgi:putative hydroxymethylpyrimidine transport system substrate-binding protein